MPADSGHPGSGTHTCSRRNAGCPGTETGAARARDLHREGSGTVGHEPRRARPLACSPLLLPHIKRPAVGLGVRRHMFSHHNSFRRGDRLATGEVLHLAEREAHRPNRQTTAQSTLNFPLGAWRERRWLRGKRKMERLLWFMTIA